jgi:hypothetical protein
MIEILKNISFIKDVSTNVNEKNAAPQHKRNIGILNGVGDVIFKDDWYMSEEELLGVK